MGVRDAVFRFWRASQLLTNVLRAINPSALATMNAKTVVNIYVRIVSRLLRARMVLALNVAANLSYYVPSARDLSAARTASVPIVMLFSRISGLESA